MRASVAVDVLVHVRSTVVDVIVPAIRPVGASGAAATVVIPDSTMEGSDVTEPSTVDTLKLYVVEGVSPVTVAVSVVIEVSGWYHVFQLNPESEEYSM
jgi:hypothetical protein